MDTNNKTVEELNELLYEKMEREQAEYKQSLVDMEPLEILNHAYEYAIREDIVYALGYYDLPENQCRALLKSDTPVADICGYYMNCETHYMDTIRDSIESCADQKIRDEKRSPGKEDAR